MTGETTTSNRPDADEASEPVTKGYDPFVRGPFPVGVRTIRATDAGRDRTFPVEIWYPAADRHAGADLALGTRDAYTVPQAQTSRRQAAVRDGEARPGVHPLVLYSHSSGGHRRAATFLSTHLASHGYVVAAMDHSEAVAPELARRQDETAGEKAARQERVIASRVPDVRFLLDRLAGAPVSGIGIDTARIGIVGHSFGGWTALAATAAEPRIRALVAHAPGGASNPKPGILKAPLTFEWGRDVPALYLVGEEDVSLPLDGMLELFARTPGTKRMAILQGADHLHFMDDVETLHEAVRTTAWPGDLSWIPKEMRPIAELCPGEEAHLFTRGLSLAHLDAFLRDSEEARAFLSDDLEAALSARGIHASVREG